MQFFRLVCFYLSRQNPHCSWSECQHPKRPCHVLNRLLLNPLFVIVDKCEFEYAFNSQTTTATDHSPFKTSLGSLVDRTTLQDIMNHFAHLSYRLSVSQIKPLCQFTLSPSLVMPSPVRTIDGLLVYIVRWLLDSGVWEFTI